VRQANWKDNEFVSQIWLANVVTGARFQLTRGKKSAGQRQWSPDGRWLGFITEREGSAIEPQVAKKEEKPDDPSAKEKPSESGGKPAARQIWLISPEGGEAWQLSKSESDIDGFQWSKDSKNIAFIANAPEPKSSKDRKEQFSDYDVYEKDYSQAQLWLLDVSAGVANSLPVSAKRLTSDFSLNVNSFSWSPDSTRIAFSAAKNPLLAFSGEEDIYLLDLAQNDSVKKIVALPGPDRSPIFLLTEGNWRFPLRLLSLTTITPTATLPWWMSPVLAKSAATPADVRDLTAKFDEDPDALDWGPEEFISWACKTNGHLFRVNPPLPRFAASLNPDTFLLEDISLSADFKSAAIITEDQHTWPSFR
jgi:Tol biopolymer transport system component